MRRWPPSICFPQSYRVDSTAFACGLSPLSWSPFLHVIITQTALGDLALHFATHSPSLVLALVAAHKCFLLSSLFCCLPWLAYKFLPCTFQDSNLSYCNTPIPLPKDHILTFVLRCLLEGPSAKQLRCPGLVHFSSTLVFNFLIGILRSLLLFCASLRGHTQLNLTSLQYLH